MKRDFPGAKRGGGIRFSRVSFTRLAREKDPAGAKKKKKEKIAPADPKHRRFGTTQPAGKRH